MHKASLEAVLSGQEGKKEEDKLMTLYRSKGYLSSVVDGNYGVLFKCVTPNVVLIPVTPELNCIWLVAVFQLYKM